MTHRFCVNDIVYAADCGKLHEAKILKIQSLDNHESNTKYFIHYQGWHRKYDTWIDDHLLAPLHDKRKVDKLQEKAEEMWNPSAKREEKALKDAEKGKKKTKIHFGGNKTILIDDCEDEISDKKGKRKQLHQGGNEETLMIGTNAEHENERSNPNDHSTSSESSRRTKRKGKKEDDCSEFGVGNHTGGEIAALTSSSIPEPVENAKKRRKALLLTDLVDEDDTLYSSKLHIPFDLKRHAVDEWSLITKESSARRLLILPKKSSSNVRSIFRAFLEMKKNEKGAEETVLNEYCRFMSIFLLQFDRALPTLLLFRQERQQFDKICTLYPQVASVPSIAYGAEHLIRFYVRLPKLLYGAVVGQQDIENFLGKFNDLIKFVSKKSDQYLSMAMYVSVEEAMNTMKAEGTAVLSNPILLIDATIVSGEFDFQETRKKTKHIKTTPSN